MGRRPVMQHLSRQAGVDASSRNAGTSRDRVRKYRNCPTEVDGQRFDSKKEARRFVELTILQRAGAISNLRRGERYQFYHNGVRIGSYKPDFEYVEHTDRSREHVTEDVKSTSTKTQAYMLRKKMMKAFFGIDIRET